MNGLESGVAIVNMLGSMLAGTTAGSFEGPAQAFQLARDLRDFDGVTFSELRDSGMFPVTEALQQTMVGIELKVEVTPACSWGVEGEALGVCP